MTSTGWLEYLAGLPHEGLRRIRQQEGLDKAKRNVPSQRYLLERHDIGMDSSMRLNLSEDNYAFHKWSSEPQQAATSSWLASLSQHKLGVS